MDLNQFLEDFADLVADKVIKRQKAEQLFGGWPTVDTKGTGGTVISTGSTSYPGHITVTPKSPNVTTTNIPTISEEAAEVFEGKLDEKPKSIDSDAKANRIAELSKVNIRTLRNRMAAVENKSADEYASIDKDQLVIDIWKLEAILGRTLEEEIDRGLVADGLKIGTQDIPDDNDFSEEEPEDDNDIAPLTREQAEELELRELKVLALDQGLLPEALSGLDVEAVVELLYGPKAVSEAPVASDEGSEDEEVIEITEEEIRAMSQAELRDLASNNEIPYPRLADREELIKIILNALD